MKPSPPFLRKLVLLLALAWLAFGAGWEGLRALDRQWLHPPHERPPGLWRWNTPPPARLHHMLTLARTVIPEGSRVAFSSPDTRGQAPLFRFWWAVYWMPRYELVPAHPPSLAPADPAVDYRIAYGLRVDEPEWELVLEDWAGAVYKRRRP